MRKENQNLIRKLFFKGSSHETILFDTETKSAATEKKKFGTELFRPLSWFRKCHVTWNVVDKSRIDSGRKKLSLRSYELSECEKGVCVCVSVCAWMHMCERERERESGREIWQSKIRALTTGRPLSPEFRIKHRWRCRTERNIERSESARAGGAAYRPKRSRFRLHFFGARWRSRVGRHCMRRRREAVFLDYSHPRRSRHVIWNLLKGATPSLKCFFFFLTIFFHSKSTSEDFFRDWRVSLEFVLLAGAGDKLLESETVLTLTLPKSWHGKEKWQVL